MGSGAGEKDDGLSDRQVDLNEILHERQHTASETTLTSTETIQPCLAAFVLVIMPKSLEKTRKRIAKKRNGNVVLHEFSRDTKKLHKAQVRDERLEKLAAARKKHDQPLSS
jgi:hypothetical protein